MKGALHHVLCHKNQAEPRMKIVLSSLHGLRPASHDLFQWKGFVLAGKTKTDHERRLLRQDEVGSHEKSRVIE